MATTATESAENSSKVSTSTKYSTSDVQRQKREIIEHLKKPLRKGDLWYLVDTRWFKQWKTFVGYDTPDQFGAAYQLNYPGPIDNSSLCAGDGCTLKERLIDELDFNLLPEEAWRKLVSWYGVASEKQTLPRKVVEHGMYIKSFKVEVYLTEFKLAQYSAPQTFIMKQFSRGDTVDHVMSEMKKLFSIPEETETRVWYEFMSNSRELLNMLNHTVQIAGLYQGQVLIIEQKSKDGTWESEPSQRQQRKVETEPESQAKASDKSGGFAILKKNKTAGKKTAKKQDLEVVHKNMLFPKSADTDPGRASAETFRKHSRETEERLNSLKKQLRVKEKQAANLSGNLRQTEEQKDSLQRQYLSEIEQHLTKFQDQLRETESVEAELRVELKTQGEHKENVESQLMEVEQQLQVKHKLEENLQSQLRDAQQQLREKIQREETLESQVSVTQQQLAETEQQLTNSQRQLQEKDLRESTLIEELIDKEQQRENSQRQLREKQQQLANYEGQVREKDEERANLDRQLRTKGQELNEFETSLSAAQQTISELRRQETCDWVIARDEIQINEKCLGKGGWGSVNEGTYCGCVVAVKQIHELILSPHNRRLFEREMNIASRCRHPCLLQFIGATNDEGSPLFVTELMETSLRALLQQQQFSEAEICVISVDVALALNYLHQRRPSPILHRDVSSANVLLWRQGDQWRGKVSDYGTANFMQQTMTIGPGAPIYSAPEAHTSNQTVKVDVYSFGVLLCEMCIRELPDPRRREEQITLMANRGLRGLVRRCLQTDPGSRPDMPQIIHELEQFKGTL